MTWIMIHKKYESSEKSEKLPPGRPTKVDVRVGKAANGQYFSTQMLFHYHLLLYIQLFLRHGLSIYHCAVDKGNYCDLYLGWGRLTHTQYPYPLTTKWKSALWYPSLGSCQFFKCSSISSNSYLVGPKLFWPEAFPAIPSPWGRRSNTTLRILCVRGVPPPPLRIFSPAKKELQIWGVPPLPPLRIFCCSKMPKNCVFCPKTPVFW